METYYILVAALLCGFVALLASLQPWGEDWRLIRQWFGARIGDYALRLHAQGKRTKAMRMARFACKVAGFRLPPAVKPHARTYAMIHELGPEDYRVH